MPKVVDRAERRDALIHAAMAVFAEHGYHRSTMQAVAERAGVSKGGIYGYFESKEDLLLGTAETLLTALSEQSLRVLETGDAPIRERVVRFVESLITGVDAWNELSTSILQVWAELGADADQPLRKLMADLYLSTAERITRVFDEAVTRGEAAPFATDAAALALMAALDGEILQAILIPDRFKQAFDSGLVAQWCASIVPPPPTNGASQ